MQLFQKPEAVITDYPLRKVGNPKALLFLDIETTGLSSSTAQVYLIGALSYAENSGWILRQWFADSLSAEEEVLRSFFDFIRGFRTLIHYNGDSFDLPFLLRCAAQYGLSAPFSEMNSLDLYRAVRPYRRIFGTERMNQKRMEQFLGVKRTDRYTGAELISVYEEWIGTGERALQQRLLLHNEADVSALPQLLSLLSYRDLFSGAFFDVSAVSDVDSVRFSCRSESFVPVAVSCEFPLFALSAEADRLTLTVPVFSGTMAHYFENYRDYYYLPLENQVIHRSLAEFVDRSAKVRASAQNACIAKNSRFIPLFGDAPAGQKLFRKDLRSARRYLDLEESGLSAENSAFLLSYLCGALTEAGLRP
ncbi:MAG: ribonuclease H-like domain-containing protein [Stomatobaculum sp.]